MLEKNLILTSFLPKLFQRASYHNSHVPISSSILIRKRTMSTTSPTTKVTEDDVIFETKNGKGIVTLNRPKALNALNLSMVEKLYPTLKAWESDKKIVIVKGAGEKSFCAGGDVRAVVEGGLKFGQKFFGREYLTNGLIGAYRIPYVALIDGIVMGGGVGLSVHGRYRIATERTLFAMPETQIGLFPDVGGSYFLPRMRNKLGYYLALTGYRLKGHDVLRAGVATHLCDSKDLAALERALVDNCQNDQDIKQTLSKYTTEASLSEFTLAPYLSQIDHCFSGATVEEILNRLEKDGSKWALDTVKLLNKMSPTSLKVTKKQLDVGSKLNLQECLQMEYRLATNCLSNKDFYEGVRALLIDKDQKPAWNPSKLSDVSEEFVDSYFEKLPEEQELKHKL